MKISDEILHKLHELDCEDVAKRFGIDVKRHKAHCFNHDDRIASLGFRGNHWKCFSCGIGGDAITFIQEKFSVSFVEACRILTDEYGIPISYGRYSAKRTSPIINWCKKESTSDTLCLFDREVAEFILGTHDFD